ncbi:hypothetical protein AVEN_10219-1 [Araneus ventricosus]|uniref:Uncharacterized protein n=1 Tax=Araneus ventricosus TaxID=182803 RepID=A0A4Y2HHR9_ARAVE|nr:hypothetical protein AVEN_10219-1 [Araneus ventricosus]
MSILRLGREDRGMRQQPSPNPDLGRPFGDEMWDLKKMLDSISIRNRDLYQMIPCTSRPVRGNYKDSSRITEGMSVDRLNPLECERV